MPFEGIVLKNLTLSYQRHPAVHHLSGVFPRGSMTAIMGPNGGGKSTLIKALAGLHPIDEGQIERTENQTLNATAYLPQNLSWDRQFPISVYDLVSQALITETPFWRPNSSKQKLRIQEALEQVDLWDWREKSIGTLSLGQFQRALFARVILQDAQVVLLDEPLTGLDEKSIHTFFDLLKKWQQQGRTLIVVLHDRQLAMEHFEQTLILSQESLGWGPSLEVLQPQIWKQALSHKSLSFTEAECPR